VSFKTPEYTANSDALGALRILEGIRILGLDTKFYQASTSEMFGITASSVQNEDTPFHPASPYGVAKLYAHWITRNYRESYGIFATTGILFNHESPRRGETFVTSKIVRGLSSVREGGQPYLALGNLDSVRDWGHAKDFVGAMYLIMQHDTPDDYVIATGEPRSVREFVELAGSHFGMNIKWQGEGLEEVGVDINTHNAVVRVDRRNIRPLDVPYLLGDYTKAREVLGWTPKISFDELVREMCSEEN
jgi:GDPmannose 4,6-dehydratase